MGEICCETSREAQVKLVPRGARKAKRANAKRYQQALNKRNIKK